MNKIVILGTGSYAKLVTYYISKFTDFEICAYSENQEYMKQTTFLDKPIVPFETVEKSYRPETYGLFMGIGYRNMNANREKIFLQAKQKGFEFQNFIHPSAVLNDTQMGEGNFIMEHVIMEPFTQIGDDNIIMSGAYIAHDNIVGSHNFFSLYSGTAGNARLGNNCFLGVRSCVTNGIEIADYTLVGGGAYVSHATSPYDVVVPAKSQTLDGKKSTDCI